MIIDTHAHLDFPEFEGEIDAIIARAAEAGVTRIITIGTSVEASRRAVALAQAHPQIYAAIGIHPNEAIEAAPEAIAALRELAGSPRVVAIGETGLDYYRLPSQSKPRAGVQALGDEETSDLEAAIQDGAVKSAQAAFFQAQLDLAAEFGLNAVVHQRGDCWDETVKILAPYQGKVRAVFHCFAGTAAQAEELVRQGQLVSFTGIVTFKNAPLMQEAAASVPSGGFMVETDCPYLAPVPFRGQRCEPAFVRYTAEKIAALRGESLETVARSTTAAAEEFFRFSR